MMESLNTILRRGLHPLFSGNSLVKDSLENHSVPNSWCETGIKLVFRRGDAHAVTNRLSSHALTSTAGKLDHKIIALRLEQFVVDNNIIDASLQKVS